MLPFKIAPITHWEHHRHTNDPDLDRDYGSHADIWWQAILTGIKRRQPGWPNSHALTLKRLGGSPGVDRAAFEGMLQTLSFWAILSARAWTGHAPEAPLIWWLPRAISAEVIFPFS